MSNSMLLDVTLTVAESKAIIRLVEAGIAEIGSDPTPVGNEVTLRRAMEAAQRGAEKIKVALSTAEAPSE